MRYMIVSDEKPKRFEEKVNRFIKEGWKPLGGAFSFTDGVVLDNPRVGQAMIKEESC